MRSSHIAHDESLSLLLKLSSPITFRFLHNYLDYCVSLPLVEQYAHYCLPIVSRKSSSNARKLAPSRVEVCLFVSMKCMYSF